MGRLAGFTYRQVTRKLRRLGFEFDRQARGSHEIWWNHDTRYRTTIPNHPGDLPEGTLSAILKQAGVTFALCINNEGYEASLDVGKVYRIISDKEAAAHGYIRIIDESGEDYAFGDSRFHRVDLPDAVGEILESAKQV